MKFVWVNGGVLVWLYSFPELHSSSAVCLSFFKKIAAISRKVGKDMFAVLN
jgi:hypothetical protein